MYKSIDELRRDIRMAHHVTPTEDDVDRLVELFRKILRDGNLWGLRELRNRLGLNPSAAGMRAWRGSIPAPAGKISAARFWFVPDTEQWIAENPKVVVHHDAQEAS